MCASSLEATATVEPTPLSTATIVSDPTTRYFLVKSYNNDNIGRSLQHGVWATSQRNEKVFGGAYQDQLPHFILHLKPILPLSPGRSQAQGKNVFCGPDGSPFPGKMFSVHWVTNCDVFFRDSEHIANAYNENKPVKVGRDGQEIDPVAGRRLCLLLESKQPGHSRPAPLLLESQPVDDQAQSSELTSVPPPSLQSSSALQQLALVAQFLKREAKPGPIKQETVATEPDATPYFAPTAFTEPGTSINTATSPAATSPAAQLPNELPRCSPGSVVHWDFNWAEEEVFKHPYLSVFPIDLTKFRSYDEYLQVYQVSQDKLDLLRTQVHPFPNLPPSIALSTEQMETFDAEVVLRLFSRSAPREETNEIVQNIEDSFTHNLAFPTTRPNIYPSYHRELSTRSSGVPIHPFPTAATVNCQLPPPQYRYAPAAPVQFYPSNPVLLPPRYDSVPSSRILSPPRVRMRAATGGRDSARQEVGFHLVTAPRDTLMEFNNTFESGTSRYLPPEREIYPRRYPPPVEHGHHSSRHAGSYTEASSSSRPSRGEQGKGRSEKRRDHSLNEDRGDRSRRRIGTDNRDALRVGGRYHNQYTERSEENERELSTGSEKKRRRGETRNNSYGQLPLHSQRNIDVCNVRMHNSRR